MVEGFQCSDDSREYRGLNPPDKVSHFKKELADGTMSGSKSLKMTTVARRVLSTRGKSTLACGGKAILAINI